MHSDVPRPRTKRSRAFGIGQCDIADLCACRPPADFPSHSQSREQCDQIYAARRNGHAEPNLFGAGRHRDPGARHGNWYCGGRPRARPHSFRTGRSHRWRAKTAEPGSAFLTQRSSSNCTAERSASRANPTKERSPQFHCRAAGLYFDRPYNSQKSYSKRPTASARKAA